MEIPTDKRIVVSVRMPTDCSLSASMNTKKLIEMRIMLVFKWEPVSLSIEWWRWLLSALKGDLFLNILLTNTCNKSYWGMKKSAKQTAGAESIWIEGDTVKFILMDLISKMAMVIPMINEPVSPIKSLFVVPKTL